MVQSLAPENPLYIHLERFMCYLYDVVVRTPHYRENQRAHAGGTGDTRIQEERVVFTQSTLDNQATVCVPEKLVHLND